MSEEIQVLVETLSQIEQDDSIPRNIKTKLKSAITALQDAGRDNKIKASRALQELDDVSDDPNMPSYVRPQIWNVVSILEGF